MGNLIITLLFSLMIFMIIFLALDKSTSGMIMNDTMIDLNATNTTFSQNIRGTMVIVNTTWMYIPILFILGLIFFTVDKSREGG